MNLIEVSNRISKLLAEHYQFLYKMQNRYEKLNLNYKEQIDYQNMLCKIKGIELCKQIAEGINVIIDY